jgi:hypothetical protein
MRQEVIDYVSSLPLGSFLLTQELPWDSDGQSLYLKNLKKVYVGITEYVNEPIITTLSGLSINNESQIVRIFFACDAKQLPSDYEQVVQDIKTVKDIITVAGVNNRTVNITTEFVNDLLATEMEVRFTKLST